MHKRGIHNRIYKTKCTEKQTNLNDNKTVDRIWRMHNNSYSQHNESEISKCTDLVGSL